MEDLVHLLSVAFEKHSYASLKQTVPSEDHFVGLALVGNILDSHDKHVVSCRVTGCLKGLD